MKDNSRITWKNNADIQSRPTEMETNLPCIQQKREERTFVNENLNGPFENEGIICVDSIDPNSGMTALSNQHVQNNMELGVSNNIDEKNILKNILVLLCV